MTAASIDPSGRAAASPVVGSAGRPDRRLAARSVPSHRAVPGWALASAGLSPVVLVGAGLVADALQPGSYSPVRQTMSALAGHAATHRWVMSGAMCLVATCYLLTALGLAGLPTSARVVLAVAGVSGIGIAASPEPSHGSTPQHLVWTAVGAAAIAAWPAFVARRTPPRPRPLVLSIHPRLSHRDRHLRGPARVGPHGNPPWQRPRPGRADDNCRPDVVAFRRCPRIAGNQPQRIGEPGPVD